MRYIAYLLIVTVSLLEASVRFLKLAPALEPQYAYFVADPILPYRTAPNEVFTHRSTSDEFDFEYRHNSLGFRDIEHTLGKPDSVFRILGLGDSFTYGAGAPFEDTYLRRLEKMLNDHEAVAESVEVIKAGIPRYFPKPERIFLQHYGLQFKPDLILVGFVPNDVMDTYMGVGAVTVDESGYLKTDEASEIGPVGTFLYLHSHVFRILLRRYVDEQVRNRYKIDWPEVFKSQGLYEHAWETIESEYAEMVERARSAGAEIAFVHIPISPYDAAYFGIDSDKVAYPADRLRKWAEIQKVVFIDALPVMEKVQKDRALYWREDGHCNSEGYGIIAETIYEALIAHGLVPL